MHIKNNDVSIALSTLMLQPATEVDLNDDTILRKGRTGKEIHCTL